MHEDEISASLAQFRALVADDGPFSISHFVLGLIRELNDGRQVPEQQITAIATCPDRDLCQSALNWLAAQGILTRANGKVQLTATGLQSLANATRSDKPMSNFLAGHQPEPDRAQANHMVLAILRARLDLRNSDN